MACEVERVAREGANPGLTPPLDGPVPPSHFATKAGRRAASMGKNKPLKVKAGDRLRAALKPTEHQKLVKPRQKGKLGQSPDERRAKAKLKAEKARTAAEWEAKQAADEHASLAKGLAREQGQGNKKSEEKAASSVLKRLHNGFLSAFDSLRRQWPPEMARLFSPQVVGSAVDHGCVAGEPGSDLQ